MLIGAWGAEFYCESGKPSSPEGNLALTSRDDKLIWKEYARPFWTNRVPLCMV
jgi:hypothetical protein